MLPGISTHVFLLQRLTARLLDRLRDGGAAQIEVFAARHHFDYTDRAAVRELAGWFRSNDVRASLHMPLFAPEDAAEWSRHTAPTLNLISIAKGQRIAAMDEVKRALEAAEMVPFRSAVVHLGLGDEKWNTRAIDDSLTALEHLKAFSGPLGVQLLLENLNNDVATPEHLAEIVRVGHFDSIGFCLDTGHAHLLEPQRESSHEPAKSGIARAFEAFGDRLRELHLHDNRGTRDEHLWPGDGTVDFADVQSRAAGLKEPPAGVLEIAYDLGQDEGEVARRARASAEALAASGSSAGR